MEKIRQHSPLLIVGLFLLGVCMRMPITAIPSILKEIAQSLGVQSTSLGILTTIPLLCFALLSSLVSLLGQRFGNELTIELALILMVVGSGLRVINFSALLLGTVIVGAAITCINVLLPAIIADKFSHQIGSVTGMCNVAMSLFAAIGAYAISPVTQATSWRVAIVIISLLALVAALVWLPNLKYNQRTAAIQESPKRTNMWKNVHAWWLMLFFGGQSFVFYSIVTWLPTVAQSAGLTSDQASLIAGLFQLFSIPFAFLVPVVAAKMQNRQPIIIFAGTLITVGTIMMMVAPKSFAYFTVVAFLLGIGTTTTFSLSMTLFSLKTRTAADTRQLSGMAQTVGYLIASLGPVTVASLYSLTASWGVSLAAIVVVAIILTFCGVVAEKQQFV